MPPTGKPASFNRFNALLWGLFVLISLYLLAWPPLEGLWAKRSWQQIPCYAPKESGQYYFAFEGKSYASTRKTLWTVINASPFAATPGAELMGGSVCYVRRDTRGGPGIAVLTPLAAPTQEQFMSRLAVMVMVLGAVLIMTWRVRKSARAPAAETSPK